MVPFIMRTAILLALIFTPPVGTVILFFFANWLWVKYGELRVLEQAILQAAAEAEAEEAGEWEFGGLDTGA